MPLGPLITKATWCSKNHVHAAWNTTGVLNIAKCESVCGFCQKETKTAANLRKHAVIHIKNEGLDLTIAEGSSGRGRLEMSPYYQGENSSSPPVSVTRSEDGYRRNSIEIDSLSPNRPHMPAQIMRHSSSSPPVHHTRPSSRPHSYVSFANPPTYRLGPSPPDPFRQLRSRNIGTKTAWAPIPASEGFKILDLCKSLSVAQPLSPSSGDPQLLRTPCYNRETLFDEEWQAHMRDVHGVYLIWPETWMRQIEVLDLDAFHGDIGVCNDLMMNASRNF